MHTIHHTHAVVLQSMQSGEANKRVWLFTKEFGLIIAMVQGVRKAGAKLQSHIQDYTVIKADIVKGREVWRLINAKVLEVPVSGKTRNPIVRAYVRTLAFLVRFLADEGPHEEVFNHVEAFAFALHENKYDPKTLDAVSIWRILVLLGYIAPTKEKEFLISEPFPETVKKVPDELRVVLVVEAKKAIIESHL